MNDITADENAWTLVHRPSLSAVALPWRDFTLELFKSLTLSLSTVPTTRRRHESRVAEESSRLSPETMASNPLVFSKQDEGAMVCRQVEILVERLSYGKIFGPSKAGILPSILSAPLRLSPFLGCVNIWMTWKTARLSLSSFFSLSSRGRI